MKPRAKLWFEDDGALVLSEYRVKLLRQIDECGSIAEAAKVMHLSYRRAWGKVREIEENLNTQLVESVKGGPVGGASRLTDEGRRMVQRFERYRAAMELHAEREYARAFSGE